MTRAQKVVRDISFDSEVYDVYNPKFDSDNDDQNDSERFEDEEADGKICDERLSELNPCNDSLEESSASQKSSDRTELARCSQGKHDSENLQEDEIRESIANKEKYRGAAVI